MLSHRAMSHCAAISSWTTSSLRCQGAQDQHLSWQLSLRAQSMADTDIWIMSLAAVFAASKSEDNPRALQDILYTGLRPERVGKMIKPPRTKLFQKTKTDPQVCCDSDQCVVTAHLLVVRRGSGCYARWKLACSIAHAVQEGMS